MSTRRFSDDDVLADLRFSPEVDVGVKNVGGHFEPGLGFRNRLGGATYHFGVAASNIPGPQPACQSKDFLYIEDRDCGVTMGFYSSSSGPSAETAKTVGPEIEALLDSYSAESILDYIARRVGHEPQMPGWTEPLRELHRHSRKIGLQVIPDFWYTPVFNPDAVPAPVWNGSFFDCAAFSLERGLEFLRKHHRFLDELSKFPLQESGDTTKYYWDNPQFSHVDAATYYSLVRSLQPKQVIEIGVGFSTMLAVEAIRKNGSGEIVCIDPHPPDFVHRFK